MTAFIPLFYLVFYKAGCKTQTKKDKLTRIIHILHFIAGICLRVCKGPQKGLKGYQMEPEVLKSAVSILSAIMGLIVAFIVEKEPPAGTRFVTTLEASSSCQCLGQKIVRSEQLSPWRKEISFGGFFDKCATDARVGRGYTDEENLKCSFKVKSGK